MLVVSAFDKQINEELKTFYYWSSTLAQLLLHFVYHAHIGYSKLEVSNYCSNDKNLVTEIYMLVII